MSLSSEDNDLWCTEKKLNTKYIFNSLLIVHNITASTVKDKGKCLDEFYENHLFPNFFFANTTDFNHIRHKVNNFLSILSHS